MRKVKLYGKEVVINHANMVLTHPVNYLAKAFLILSGCRVKDIYSEIDTEILRNTSYGYYDERIICLLSIAEDRRFLYHHGLDFYAVIRSTISTIFLRNVQGASTIEMQLARVIRNDYERTVIRKVREIVAANYLSQKLNKHQIASIYLNSAYYGVGVQKETLLALSQDFDNNLPEICKIISHIKYPNRSCPTSDWTRKVFRRANYLEYLYSQNCEK